MWNAEVDDLCFDEDDDQGSFCESWMTPVKKRKVKKKVDAVKSAKVEKSRLNPVENLYMCEQLSPDNPLSVHHVLYVLDRLTLEEYVSALKTEMKLSKQMVKDSFTHLVLDDKKWVNFGTQIRERLKDLFQHKDVVEIIEMCITKKSSRTPPAN